MLKAFWRSLDDHVSKHKRTRVTDEEGYYQKSTPATIGTPSFSISGGISKTNRTIDKLKWLYAKTEWLYVKTEWLYIKTE